MAQGLRSRSVGLENQAPGLAPVQQWRGGQGGRQALRQEAVQRSGAGRGRAWEEDGLEMIFMGHGMGVKSLGEPSVTPGDGWGTGMWWCFLFP